MSQKYTGGFITKSPVAPTTTAASGIWTLDQQQQAQKAGTWPSPPMFIEDLFSTYLYTGSNSATTITNGIDLSTKGGLVWTKGRTGSADNHLLIDTVRGVNKPMRSNESAAQYTETTLTAFNTTGYDITGANGDINLSGRNYVSWTFEKQSKFFDVVTYTGNGTAGRTIAHNLGSVPGCIIVKQIGGGSTGGVNNWFVYHRSLGGTKYLGLDDTFAAVTSSSTWNNTDPTSTVFTIGGTSDCNDSGGTYIAYLFAHDAGGFPVSGGGSTNGISCGTFTTDGSGNATVSLGYEPQWVISKRSSGVAGWEMFDNMRGMTVAGLDDALLYANSSDAEVQGTNLIAPNAIGFSVANEFTSSTYIYIAIRRGPMKTPTVGTSVFTPDLYTGNGTTQSVTSGSPPLDLVWIKGRTGSNNPRLYDRLRGATISLAPDSTAAETTRAGGLTAFTQTGFTVGSNGNENESGVSIIAWDFKRAPSFFDEVCYTGTGSTQTLTHNLGVAPELMIVKSRSAVVNWKVYQKDLGTLYGGGNPAWQYNLTLNSTASTDFSASRWSQDPTSTVFGVATNADTNGSGSTYVAYLFATCAGVSKVGSYTGNAGNTVTVPCGFTAGVRFVLIKRTDSTGDWYVWDSARGIVSGNDPYLLLNTSTNEVTGTDYVDTYSAGFEVTSTAPAALNATGGTYIFLAVA